MRSILTPAQIHVVEVFNPCLIPPKELRDPVRAGEANTETAEIEQHLRTLRRLSDRAFPAVAEAFAELVVEMIEEGLGVHPAGERAAEVERLATSLVTCGACRRRRSRWRERRLLSE
ncbi:MAG: hypothetical protein AB1486_33405 [Planctomycetota bacterium]